MTQEPEIIRCEQCKWGDTAKETKVGVAYREDQGLWLCDNCYHPCSMQ